MNNIAIYATSAMQSSLKTRATSSNDPVSSSALMPTPAITAQTAVGPAWSNCMPEPTATRSAAMFSAFATISNPTRPITMLRALPPSRTVASSPNPLPVASAVRSQISWTVAINGNVSSAVQRNPKPKLAPACA